MKQMSNQRLRILQIEDNRADAELIQRALLSESLDFEFVRVDSEAGLMQAFGDSPSFDLVLSDYRLPTMGSTAALRIVHELAPELPFIFVTGAVGEELAVETLKMGATDFVLKDNMARLGFAVRRAIIESNKLKGLRQAEQALRESEEKYRTLVERVPVIVYIAESGHSGRWHYVSPRIESILGFTADEWLQTPNLWFDQVLPEDRQDAVLSDPHLQDVHVVEYRIRKKNGSIIWIRDEAVVLKSDHDGFLIHGLMIEITDLKNAEETKLSIEKKLRQIQNVEAVGQLAGGIAHDFNNILMVISSYCELLQIKLAPADPNMIMINEIKGAADKGAALTRQLLAFSRKQKIARTIVDLNQVIQDMQLMVRHLIREDIELSVKIHDGLHPVKVDSSQIERLIVNLVVNARDAMPNGGRLTISTMNLHTATAPGRTPASYAVLDISDTGVGMDQEMVSHIFEPFFTTKEEGKGTGLGLSTAHGIVKQNDGHIEVNSKPGAGTTFRVLFPAAPVSD